MEEAKRTLFWWNSRQAAWFFKKRTSSPEGSDFGWLLLCVPTVQDCWLVVNVPLFLFKQYCLSEIIAFTAPSESFFNVLQNNYDEGVFSILYNRFSHDVTWRRVQSHLSPRPGVRSSLKESDLILWPAFPVSASSLSRLIFLCSFAVLSQFSSMQIL